MISDKRMASNHRRIMQTLKTKVSGLSAEWGEVDGGVESALDQLAQAVDTVITQLDYVQHEKDKEED